MRAVTSTLFAAFVASVVNAQSSEYATASPVGGAPAAGSSAGNVGASPSGLGTVAGTQSAGAGQGATTPAASSASAPVAPSSAAATPATSGAGAVRPSGSTGGAGLPGTGSNSTVGGNTTTTGNGTAGGYPYLNGTQAVDFLLKSLNLSTGCQSTVTSLTSNATAEGQCLHTGVVWAGEFSISATFATQPYFIR